MGNGEINRLRKGRGRESVREAGKVKIFQTIVSNTNTHTNSGGQVIIKKCTFKARVGSGYNQEVHL